jgi:RNA polymerase sigma-70 factor (ECF subfamily)
MDAPTPAVTPSFEQTMLPHLDAAYNLARWLLRHEQDAEDAVQESLLKAWQAFGRFRGTEGKPWLMTIVRNVCYSRLRQSRKVALEPFVDEAHGAGDLAEVNAVNWSEMKAERLQKGLESLTQEYREVLVLHELEGLSYREISAIAAIPMGTVMSRLARARAKLTKELSALA